MSDLSSSFDYKFSKLNCVLYTNGNVETVTEDGVPINQLCGNLKVLHKVAPLIYAVNRRKWMNETFDFDYLPTIEFFIIVVYANGEYSERYPIKAQQIISLLKFIKK